MNVKNYILPFVILILVVFGVWLFWKVLIYLFISTVLFLIGSPLTGRIKRIRLGQAHIGNGLAALLTLLLMFAVFSSFFILILPPLVSQIGFMSKLNFYDVLHNILELNPGLKSALSNFGTEADLHNAVNGQFSNSFDFGTVSVIVNNLFAYLASFLGGLFCVLFITFFFLKDKQTVSEVMLLVTPQRYEHEIRDILHTSKKMLSNYFTGLLIDILIVGSLAGISLWMLGIKNALIIGFMAGLFNLIPYLGPIITLCFALFLGVSGCIELQQYDLISPTVGKIVCALLLINMADAVFLQPYIFSNRVKAHPLEIFLVTLMAGTIGGIGGMVVAIPVYTLIRIIAREFLSHFKFFKKLTESISE
ncbi:MAG: AI-2E family transporter [Bacteroidia bacterium]